MKFPVPLRHEEGVVGAATEATSRGFWTEVRTGDSYLGVSDMDGGPGRDVRGREAEEEHLGWLAPGALKL